MKKKSPAVYCYIILAGVKELVPEGRSSAHKWFYFEAMFVNTTSVASEQGLVDIDSKKTGADVFMY